MLLAGFKLQLLFPNVSLRLSAGIIPCLLQRQRCPQRAGGPQPEPSIEYILPYMEIVHLFCGHLLSTRHVLAEAHEALVTSVDEQTRAWRSSS